MNILVYGASTGVHDWIPERAIGPTDDALYEVEKGFNDQEVSQILGKPLSVIQTMETTEKRQILMDFRKKQLRHLISVYYQERGWTESGIPRIDTLKKIGLWDFMTEEARTGISEIKGS
jgi:aldehyde:ferredoxin oxidoreductase